MSKLVLAILLISFSYASLAKKNIVFANNKTKYQANKFYAINKRESLQIFSPKNQDNIKPLIQKNDCRKKIKTILCLVDKAKPEQGSNERECLPGGEIYASHFESLFDNYPKPLQKIFCSLNIIYIEKQFFGTAYAGTVVDNNGNLDGAMMGIRKSVLDENLHLTQWASWKEQLSFGGKKNDYQVSSDLPLISTTTTKKVNDFLYFLVAHEFGHIFDFSNNLNEFINCGADSADKCDHPKPGSWSELSWASSKVALGKDDFYQRVGLCFYGCQDTFILQEDISQLYSELYSSTFISTYAATNPWDDFAESLAYIAMEKYLKPRYMIAYDGETFDVMAKLRRANFSDKYTFIDDFLKRSDIIYP